MDNTELLITLPENAAENTDLDIGLPEMVPEILMTPNICVIGVGGAGGNAINNMIESRLTGARFVVANTDAQVMARSLTHERIQLGAAITKGLGAGSNPDVGKAAAEESSEKIKEALQGVNLLFIAAGMGGGTGTGASPVVAKIAKEMGILTVGVVTKPFRMEGNKRMRVAEAGIQELSKYVDTLITVPNQNLFLITGPQTTIKQAFKMADDILYQGVKSITDLMITTMEIHVDFADFKTVTQGMGKAIMGSGEASGENRALIATEKAIVNPLLDVSMKGAKGVLISLSGKDISLTEAEEATERIRQEVDEDANIIFGICLDENLGDKIRVSVVATGLEHQKESKNIEIDRELGRPEPIIITASKDEEKKEEETQKAPTIFVPAAHPENPQALPQKTPQEQSISIEPPEESFIPVPAIEIKPDESILEDLEKQENDLFPTLLNSLTKPEKIEKQEKIVSPTNTTSKEKKRGGLFSFFGDKAEEELVERNKARLKKEPDTNTLPLPKIPDEDAINIPPYMERQQKLEEKKNVEDIPTFLKY